MNKQDKRLANLPGPLHIGDLLPQPPLRLLLSHPRHPRSRPIRLPLKLVRASLCTNSVDCGIRIVRKRHESSSRSCFGDCFIDSLFDE